MRSARGLGHVDAFRPRAACTAHWRRGSVRAADDTEVVAQLLNSRRPVIGARAPNDLPCA